MIAAAKAANRKLMVGYRVRYEPYNQALIAYARDTADVGPTRLMITVAPASAAASATSHRNARSLRVASSAENSTSSASSRAMRVASAAWRRQVARSMRSLWRRCRSIQSHVELMRVIALDGRSNVVGERIRPIRIDPPGTASLEHDLDMLSDVLHAVVHDGAGVSFVVPFSMDDARVFWLDKVLPGVRAGTRRVVVARLGSRIDHLQRLQREDARHARPRVRAPLRACVRSQPGDHRLQQP